MRVILMLCAVVCIAAAATAQTTNLFIDGFESYTVNSDLLVANGGKWQTNTVASGGPSTVDFHGGAKSMMFNTNDAGFACGGFTGTVADNTQSVVCTWWLRDFGTGVGRELTQIGSYSGGYFGSGTLNNLMFVGPYSTSGQATYWSRVVYAPSGAGYVNTNVARINGWVEVKMELGHPADATRVRHLVNGTAITRTFTAPAGGWNSVKIGPVAGTALRVMYIDDVNIDRVIPAVPVSTSGIWID